MTKSILLSNHELLAICKTLIDSVITDISNDSGSLHSDTRVNLEIVHLLMFNIDIPDDDNKR